jgi:hypothetical protein
MMRLPEFGFRNSVGDRDFNKVKYMDISTSIEQAVATYFSQWLGVHPYLGWIISHPLPGMGLLLLTIFSLWGLIKAIGRGIEQIWLFLLTTPFRLLQPMFRLMWSAIRRMFGHNSANSKQPDAGLGSISDPEQIEDLAETRSKRIIDRLQILNQEQELLLSELSTLAGSSSTLDTQYKDLYAKLPKLN